MLELYDADSSSKVADWVELNLALGENSISRATLASILEASSGDNDESFISDVWRYLQKRQDGYVGQFYKCDDDIVVRINENAPPEYVLCLLFSIYGVSNEKSKEAKLFERLAAEAIENYIQGKVFIFGWPVLPELEADIAARIKEFADSAHERFAEKPLAQYKDRGVDIIAWKPFQEHIQNEHRSNQFVLLAQCAAGGNWRKKTTELPYKSWTQYIHWACDPLQGFAVPVVVPDDLWHDISRECGILFDRIRILNNLPNGIKDTNLKTDIQEWIKQKVEEENQ